MVEAFKLGLLRAHSHCPTPYSKRLNQSFKHVCPSPTISCPVFAERLWGDHASGVHCGLRAHEGAGSGGGVNPAWGRYHNGI